jgi:NAD+ kinase
MTMPLDLVLVRHGESEGNVANRRSRQGDNSAFTDEFRRRHSSKWRLTDRGIEQARAAGAWIREHIGPSFDRHYTSEYVRAMETAAHLELPDAEWYAEFYLRERDWGRLDLVTHEERLERFGEALAGHRIDSFYWSPPAGESMAQVCLRVDRVLNTLHRECAPMRVIVVCHGEIMWAFRVRLERMPQRLYHELDTSEDPHERIFNAQVLHYTRQDPATGEVQPYLNWMRSVCPWDMSQSRNTWQRIERRVYSNEDLLAEVAKTERLVGG